MQKKYRISGRDDWRAPKGSTLAAITTVIMIVVLVIGGSAAVWLLFGRDISEFYDSIFIIPEAKTRASEYISEKYGFDPEIVSAEVPDRANMIFMPSDKCDFVYVTMETDGKKFAAAVNYNDKTLPICDTYQTEEIKEAISAAIDECEPWKVRLGVHQQNDLYRYHGSGEIFFNTLFTGGNWQELHDERPLDIYIRYFDIEPVRSHFDPLSKLYAKIKVEFYGEDEKIIETFEIE